MLYINAHINDFEPSPEEIRESRRKIKFRCDSSWTTMADVLLARGWTQVDEDDNSWHLYWNDVNKTAEILDSRQFEPHQKIAHFRNHFELTRKNLLAKNLRHYKRYLKRQKCQRDVMAEIMPRTYEIPSEYSRFLADFDKSLGITWILKPASGRQGSGIFLFQDLKDLDDWREDLTAADEPGKALAAKKSTHRIRRPDTIELPGVYVVQKYVQRPYLIDGKKFDLRFYVLVTSWRPLTVWMSRDGFARICGSKYSLENLRANRVHLTNMAIQLRPGSQVDSVPGTKWKMQKLKSFLVAQHGQRATAELMERVAALVMTSLRSVAKRIRPDQRCFELYGYDVLLDEKLKPWLLEVNASPSLHATGPEDYRMKFELLTDVVNIVDFEHTFTGFESRIGGFDLLWKDGPVLTLRDAEGNAGDYDKAIGRAGALFVADSAYPDRCLNGHLGEPNDRFEQLAILKFQRQVSKVINSLPREPLCVQPSDALTVPECFRADFTLPEDGKSPRLRAATAGDYFGGKLVWDTAMVAKVSEENLFDLPRNVRAKQGKGADGKVCSDSEPDEQVEFWRRGRDLGKKAGGRKATVRKPIGTKVTVNKFGGGKVQSCKVVVGKGNAAKGGGGTVAARKVESDKVTFKGQNDKMKPSKVNSGQMTATKTEIDNVIVNKAESDSKAASKSESNCKTSGQQVNDAPECRRITPRLSEADDASDSSDSGESGSHTTDESGSENSREISSENGSEHSAPDSISRLSRKMFGSTGWCPQLT